MSNETKRDVFDDAAFYIETFAPDGPEFADDLRQRYAAAMPDNLPVIPKTVSEYIEDANTSHYELLDAMTKWTLDQPVFDWIHDNSETFARAWVLGVWHVEGTGEIVKVEAKE